jgi:GNAT superfamily N-acetyltransferase
MMVRKRNCEAAPASTGVVLATHALLGAQLRRSQLGTRFELRGLGRSLWPVVRSGSVVVVESCGESSVQRGDLVLAWLQPRASLVCHVVVSTHPIRTAPMVGAEDGEAEVLARVVDVKGHGFVRLRIMGGRRTVRALRAVGNNPHARRFFGRRARAVGDKLLQSSLLTSVRRIILESLEARKIVADDFVPLAIFAGHHLPGLSAEWIERQLHGPWMRGAGGAFAAFDRRNHIRAFGYLGHYAEEGVEVPGIWLRSLYVEPIARRLGLSRRLIEARLELALEQGFDEVYADIYRDNHLSLQLHLKHGFVEVHSDSLAPFEPLLSRVRRRGRDLVILRWSAPRASPPV